MGIIDYILGRATINVKNVPSIEDVKFFGVPKFEQDTFTGQTLTIELNPATARFYLGISGANGTKAATPYTRIIDEKDKILYTTCTETAAAADVFCTALKGQYLPFPVVHPNRIQVIDRGWAAQNVFTVQQYYIEVKTP